MKSEAVPLPTPMSISRNPSTASVKSNVASNGAALVAGTVIVTVGRLLSTT